ncbi:MAG: LEA type 2 family protein [Cyclobacteriaceae bacterium]
MIHKSIFFVLPSVFLRLLLLALLPFILVTSCVPKEKVVLRKIKDIVVDVNTEPVLRANAVLYNPNKLKMTLRKIDMEVFVDGKKAALINQKLKTKIPAEAEFTVPLEVNLNLKELGFFDTVLAVLGGKKMKIQYTGSIRLTYKSVPITIPVDYQDEIRVRI